MADVNVKLGVDTSEAERNLESFSSKITKFGAAVSAGFAAIKIGEFLADGIKEAIEAEKSLAKLSTQLKIAGEFSDAAVADFDAFASSIERSTNVSAEAVLEQSALAKSFGLTNEESQELIKAATQLSAVTGEDLSSSVDTLIKSYQGQTKELSRTIDGVQGLTKEQLKNGGAIALLNERYGGTAEAALNTYSGSLTALERGFGDISEEIGKAVISNTQLIGVIRVVTKAFEEIVDFLASNKSAINSFVSVLIDGFFGAAKGVTFLGSVIERILGGAIVAVTVPLEGLLGIFKSLAKLGGSATKSISEGFEDAEIFIKNFNEAAIKGVTENDGAFANLNEKIVEVQKSLKTTATVAKRSSDDINKSARSTRTLVNAEETQKELKKAQQEYKDFVFEITKQVASETDKVNLQRDQQLEKIRKLHKEARLSAKDLAEAEILINENASKQISEIQKKERDKAVNDAKANPIQIVFEFATGSAVSEDSLKAAGVSLATNFFSSLKQGAAGVQQIGGAIAEGIGTKLDGLLSDSSFFGLGGLLKEIFAFTSQSNDQIREQIQSFVSAIPQLIVNLSTSVSAIIEGFTKALEDERFQESLAKAIVKSTITVIPLLVKAVADFIPALFEFYGGLVRELFEALRDFINQDVGKAFEDIRKFLVDFFTSVFSSDFFKPFTDAIDRLIEKLGGIANPLAKVTGGGGVSNPLTSAGASVRRALGFAEGGIVPPGFPNDTYPAFLTSGETVVPPGRSLPDEDGSMDLNNALLAQLVSLLKQPQTVSATAELNGRAFADIVLQLNRSNARLA